MDQYSSCLHPGAMLLFSNLVFIFTQVVTLATYAYFVACLFGRQYLLPTQYKVEGDKYVPVGFPPLIIYLKMLILGVKVPVCIKLDGHAYSRGDKYHRI